MAALVRCGFFPEGDSGTLKGKKNDINDLQMELFNLSTDQKIYKKMN